MRIIYEISGFVKKILGRHKNDARILSPQIGAANSNKTLQVGTTIAIVLFILAIAITGRRLSKPGPASTMRLLSDTEGGIKELLISGGGWVCAGDYMLPYLKHQVELTVIDTGEFALLDAPPKLCLDLKKLNEYDWETWLQDPFVVLTSPENQRLQFVVSQDRVDNDRNCSLAVQTLADWAGAETCASSLVFDGGDVVSNNRHFFVTSSTIRKNCDSSGYEPERVVSRFEVLFGKDAVVVDNDGFSETLFHIDMFVTPVGEDTVVVGDTRLAAGIFLKNPVKIPEYEIGIELSAYFKEFDNAFRNVRRINHRGLTWRIHRRRSGMLEDVFLCATPSLGCEKETMPECLGDGTVVDEYMGQKLIAQIMRDYAPMLKASKKTLAWMDTNGDFQIDFLQGRPLSQRPRYQAVAARDVIPFEICWENAQGKRGTTLYWAGIAAKGLLKVSIAENMGSLADCLDGIAEDLIANGYRVRRAPLFVTVPNTQGVARGMYFPHAHPLWITYNNVLLNGNTVFLPVYGIRELDEAAIAVWWDALGFKVAPIHGLTFVSSLGGSLRCTTKVLRRG